MKNKIQKRLMADLVILTFLWGFLTLVLQILLSFIYEGMHNVKFTSAYLDVSGILWNKNGAFKIYYTDMIRIGIFLLSVIPYVFIFMKTLERLVVRPLQAMTDELKQLDYEKLSHRLMSETKYEYTELKDAFNELFDRLEDTSRTKEAAKKQKDLLIAGMAHDLKTPITTIRGYSQALADNVITEDTQREEYIEAIHRKALQLEDLITLLFDYAGLSAAQTQLHYSNMDICELLRENIGLFYTEFEEKQIQFVFDIPKETVYIYADSKQLSRVFTNLYSNALKYNHAGDMVSTTIDLTQGIQICIEDTGEAIPDEIEKHIFEPFVTGDYSRRTGTGLGLSVAAKILELHHGTIRVEHKVGSAFTKSFIITLDKEQK